MLDADFCVPLGPMESLTSAWGRRNLKDIKVVEVHKSTQRPQKFKGTPRRQKYADCY